MPGADVASAGTHAVEGQPPSSRTEQALLRRGLHPSGHRSHQLTEVDASWAALIVGFAGDHIQFVRRRFPFAASKTATLRRLCRDFEGAPTPGAAGPTPRAPGPGPVSLGQRLEGLHLAEVTLGAWEDIADPAGGELEDFERCASEIDRLTGQLAGLLGPEICVGQAER
jgi:protein-tyrosine-phosphatase